VSHYDAAHTCSDSHDDACAHAGSDAKHGLSRRDVLRCGAVVGLGLGSGVASLVPAFAQARAPDGTRSPVLVVVELAGGNDGLNTVVPHRHDVYRKLRPTLRLGRDVLRPLDDARGLHPALAGLHARFERGELAIVEGCGYPDPVRSHFSAQEFWHTARPHIAEPYGWLGRVADTWTDPDPLSVIAIGAAPPRAVAAASHAAVCFGAPDQLERRGARDTRDVYGRLIEDDAPAAAAPSDDASTPRDIASFVRETAQVASAASVRIRAAVEHYETAVSYGIETEAASLGRDLRGIAALLAADLPLRVAHVSMGGFDSHARQLQSHQLQLGYVDDALFGFARDLARLGRDQDVVVLVFTEFGRRVAENGSGGTDHGTATPVFVLGAPVRGGLYGAAPSLDALDAAGDPAPTTDFRRVYATLLDGWLDTDSVAVLGADHAPLPLLRRA
jgi:uncharacterized protein (DUF1501 family)